MASAATSSASSPPSASSTTRTTKPGTKRLSAVLSILLSFLLASPFLLKSVHIYRAPLPFPAISSLSAHLHSHPPPLPFHLHAVILLPSPGSSFFSHLRDLIVRNLESRSSNTSFSVTVTVQSDDLLGDLNLGDDEAVDEFLAGVVDRGVYTVVVVKREQRWRRVVVGKQRHAWVVGLVEEEEEAASVIGGLFWRYFVNGGREEGEMVSGDEGEALPVGSDGSLVLSFSLLNADPGDWVYDWEIEKINRALAPVLELLAPVANVSVESQVLHHAPKSAISRWDSKLASYTLGTSDLPFFVNSNEWHLDTSIAASGRSKILQFVVYIPSATDCPLLIQLPNREISKTNGFISPMWGGVIVWNPPSCSRISQNARPTKNTIPSEDLEKIFQVFIGQLRLLFGLRSINIPDAEVGVANILSSKNGFTEWELDVLYRRHSYLNLLSCASTLDSLSKLVKSLPRMIIMEEIGKQVNLSLEVANLAQDHASIGIYGASAEFSRKAKALAEDAFYHPSIMSISYSSFEHNLAIYMPFFVPVVMQVILAASREVWRFKHERAKYLASIS